MVRLRGGGKDPSYDVEEHWGSDKTAVTDKVSQTPGLRMVRGVRMAGTM